jgi:transposase
MPNGNGLLLFCLAKRAILADRERTTVCFSKQFCGFVRTGAPWRDLLNSFGKWYSVWKRFRRSGLKGVFDPIFAASSEDPDFEYALIDGTIIKVTGTAPAQKGYLSQAISKV